MGGWAPDDGTTGWAVSACGPGGCRGEAGAGRWGLTLWPRLERGGRGRGPHANLVGPGLPRKLNLESQAPACKPRILTLKAMPPVWLIRLIVMTLPSV